MKIILILLFGFSFFNFGITSRTINGFNVGVTNKTIDKFKDLIDLNNTFGYLVYNQTSSGSDQIDKVAYFAKLAQEIRKNPNYLNEYIEKYRNGIPLTEFYLEEENFVLYKRKGDIIWRGE